MSIPRFLSGAVLAVALCTGLSVSAADPAGTLYHGEVELSGPGRAGSEELQRALNQVLVRLTGRVGEDVVAAAGIPPGTAESLSLGREFRQVEVPTEAGEVRTEDRLRVVFDPDGINRLLRDAGLPRWGTERPAVLMWLVTETDAGADFAAGNPLLEHALDNASFRYGLQILRPMMDASDVAEVRVSDVRGGFVDAATAAARRYGADLVVMATLEQRDDFWTGRWVWRMGGRDQGFERSTASAAEAVDAGLGRIAGALAARFALSPEARPESRRLRISGVRNPAQYAEVLAYLSGLSRMQEVRVLSAAGDTLVFELVTDAAGLEDRIGLGDLLEFQRHDPNTGELSYRLSSGR